MSVYVCTCMSMVRGEKGKFKLFKFNIDQCSLLDTFLPRAYNISEHLCTVGDIKKFPYQTIHFYRSRGLL